MLTPCRFEVLLYGIGQLKPLRRLCLGMVTLSRTGL